MPKTSFLRWLMAVLILTLLILLAGGTWFYRSQQRQLRQRAERNLQAIAQLKMNQIVAWRAERLGDAATLTESPFFTDAAAQALENPQAGRQDEILAQFKALQKSHHYDDILLIDAAGQIRLSLGGRLGLVHEDVSQALHRALQDRQPVLTDLHRGPGDLPPHLDAVAPLFTGNESGGEPVGAVVLQIDASQFLYPLIQSWPTPSSSAETLLVRRDGDSVLYMNDLRHQPNAALTLRIPLSRTEVPAVRAVLGREGVAPGKDYRGVEVLSATLPIPDSSWFIVAKVDRSEILADWYSRSALILGVMLGLVAVVGTAGGLAWQRNQKVHFQTLFEAEKERQESETRYRTTLLSIGDGVIVTDAGGQVVLLNPVAEELTGWRQHEARGKPLEAVFHIINEETRLPAENPARRVMREGLVVGLANHTLLISREGREIPIADSGAPTYDGEESLSGVVLVFRDQTEERKAQKALQESEAYIRTILDNLPVGVAVNSVDPAVSFSYMNDNFVRYYRTTREALAAPGAFWEAAYQDAEFREAMKKRVLEDVASGDPERMHWDDVPVTREGAETTFISARNTPIHGTQVMLSTVWDTTGRKQAEEAIKLSEARYRSLIETQTDAIARSDLAGNLTLVNDAYCNTFGKSRDELLGANFTPNVLPEDLPVTLDALEAIKFPPYRKHTETRHLTPAGVRWFSWENSAVVDENGNVIELQGVGWDITESKQVEEALRESERFVRSTLDGLSAHIAILDETGTILAVNHSWRRFADSNPPVTTNVSEGTNYLVVCDQAAGPRSEEAAGFAAAIRAVLSGTLDHFEMEYPCHSPAEQRWFIGRITRFPGEGPARVVVAHEDITRSRLAEHKRDEERNLLRTLIDNLPDRVYVKDVESRFILKNLIDVRQMGADSPDEVVGKTDFDYYPPDLAQRYYTDDQAVIQSGQPLINREEPMTAADGTQGWILTTKVPLRDIQGNVIGLVGIGHDITRRKQTEDALRESNRYLSTLNRVGTALAETLDLEHIYHTAYEQVSQLVDCPWFGISLYDAEAKTLREAFMLGDGTLLDAARSTPLDPNGKAPLGGRAHAVITQQPEIVTTGRSSPDERIPQSALYVPMVAGGKTIGLLEVQSDRPNAYSRPDVAVLGSVANQIGLAIENAQLFADLEAERKLLEARVVERTTQLNHAKERVEAILNSSSDIIILLHEDGIIQQVNPVFDRIFGSTPDEVFGQPLTIFTTPEQAERLMASLRIAVESRQPQRLETSIQYKEKTAFEADLAFSPIVQPGGQILGIVCSLRDITARKQMEKGLRHMLEREIELNDLKSRFISMASHEFRTPLAVIQAASDILLRYNDQISAEKRQKQFSQIRASIKNMVALLDDVLTINKAEAGKLEFRPESLDLEACCREMLSEIERSMGADHHFAFSCTGYCAASWIDRKLLRHMIINLLSNAVKYSTPGTTVIFDVACQGDQVIFQVKDEGIGIPLADQARMFEAFHRAENVGSVHGTGLGLAIVKQSVDLHGGTVMFESEEGVGTTFTIILPQTENKADQ